MRILFPMWVVNPMTWPRMRDPLKAIARHADLEILLSTREPLPKAPWAKFTSVLPWPEITNIKSTLEFAQRVLMGCRDFDLIYCWSGGPYHELIAAEIAELAQKPIVMHINGDGHLARGFFLDPLEKLKQDTVDRIALNAMTRIVPISSTLQERIKTRIGDPENVTSPVPFSIDLHHFRPSPHPREVTYGYSGRLSPEKGLDFLLDLIREKTHRGFRAVGPIEVPNRQIPDNLHYDGVLDYQDMPDFYEKVSAVLLPSYGEGIPGSILEAYATGRPVIVTPEAHPPELAVYGWEIPRDIDAWRETMATISREQIMRRGRDARKYIETKWPTWDKYAETMMRIFQETINHES
jgi:glycosyltransferase involved in cell wall biosynthesis